MGTGGDVAVYCDRQVSNAVWYKGGLGSGFCLTEEGVGLEPEAREEALSATSLAVSVGLAAEDAVGAVPAVAVAAESVFALGLRPRLAGSWEASASGAAS